MLIGLRFWQRSWKRYGPGVRSRSRTGPSGTECRVAKPRKYSCQNRRPGRKRIPTRPVVQEVGDSCFLIRAPTTKHAVLFSAHVFRGARLDGQTHGTAAEFRCHTLE